MNRGVWVIPRQFVDFRQGGCRGIRTGIETNHCARKAQRSSPDRPVRGTYRDAIKSGVDPFVFSWIDRLIGFDIFTSLPVPVRVEDECGPALRFLFIVSLVKHPCVQPPDHSSSATATRP